MFRFSMKHEATVSHELRFRSKRSPGWNLASNGGGVRCDEPFSISCSRRALAIDPPDHRFSEQDCSVFGFLWRSRKNFKQNQTAMLDTKSIQDFCQIFITNALRIHEKFLQIFHATLQVWIKFFSNPPCWIMILDLWEFA